MTQDEIKKWYKDHDEELGPDPQRRWKPDLKRIEETVDLTYRMPELGLLLYAPQTIYSLMGGRLAVIGLPLRAVTAYINYAGHNALSIRELAVEMRVNKDTVVVWFERLRREWPQLFVSALALGLDAELAIQAEQDKSLLRRILGEDR